MAAMPAAETARSSTEIAADGTRSMPAGPGWTSPRSRPGRDDVPRMGTGRAWGAQPRTPPTVEGDDQRRGDDLPGVLEAVERHARKHRPAAGRGRAIQGVARRRSDAPELSAMSL